MKRHYTKDYTRYAILADDRDCDLIDNRSSKAEAIARAKELAKIYGNMTVENSITGEIVAEIKG